MSANQQFPSSDIGHKKDVGVPVHAVRDSGEGSR